MAYLLLISCSGTKKPDAGVLPAIERYDGTTYKVIKKARREGYWHPDIDLFIVSARYGLISEHTLIEGYNQKMNRTRALEIQSKVSQILDELLQSNPYQQIFINMGSIYMDSITLSAALDKADQASKLKVAVGGIGEKLQQTKAWLIAIAQSDPQALPFV